MTTAPTHMLEAIRALDPEHGTYIGGRGLPSASGRTFEVCDPATGGHLALFADSGSADATAAVDAAAVAFPGWSATPPRQRGETLRNAFALMISRTEELAHLISAENGKCLADSRAEVTYAAEFFRWFAEEAVRPEGSYGESPAGGTRTIVTSRPVGVAALITPWNFPAAMATRKISPALAAGCTVVIKPAAETPLTALAIVQLLEDAGVPPGTVNLVATTNPAEVVDTWLADSRVRKISFTGSTGIGRLLLARAADRIVNSSMELGGNAPFIVGPTADIEAAVAGAMIAKFRNAGQACTAANRFFIHTTAIDEFVTRFGAAIETLRVGSAFEEGTSIGPLINAKAVSNLAWLVEDALERGARISHRAISAQENGHFYAPTLLVNVSPDSAIIKTEAFGPVAPILAWRDDEQLIRQVNDSEFGLASYVYSSDLKWALQMAERIDAGMVGINRGVVSDPSAPFGGLKQSGLGREGAREGLRAFTETQYFSVDWA